MQHYFGEAIRQGSAIIVIVCVAGFTCSGETEKGNGAFSKLMVRSIITGAEVNLFYATVASCHANANT